MKKQKRVRNVIFIILLLVIVSAICLFWRSIHMAASVKRLDEGLYSMSYSGNYRFDDFLTQGGADSDIGVAEFVVNDLLYGLIDLNLQGENFGCSTLSVTGPQGQELFGRNFDWGACTALVVQTKPKGSYASISTVNMDFLRMVLPSLSEEASVRLLAPAALYAPLDGMNERGLCVAVNMIQDGPGFQQSTEKPDLTTTTAVRLLLDNAADVEEALELLGQYDLHASAGLMVHFVLTDRTGRAVVVEYIDNQMVVVDTPVVTNFYLAPGEKYGIGTEQSHARYDTLMRQLEERSDWDMDVVRDSLDSVSKHNFDSEHESTEWSIVYNQTTGEVRYFHREDYSRDYLFTVAISDHPKT